VSLRAKQFVQWVLRRTRLLSLADTMRFQAQRARLAGRNARFCRDQPGVVTPPLALLYEIGGRIDLGNYWQDGQVSSAFLASEAANWLEDGPWRVLDWGCGVACVVRHMPEVCPACSEIHGTDYNSQMIEWARGRVEGVRFGRNELLPPTRYGDGSFDWVYGLSVVTHLGEEALRAWLAEFRRVLRPGGLLTLTTMGTRSEEVLLPAERAVYAERGIVVRGQLEEGRKMYLAYHNPEYFRREVVSRGWEVLKFVPGGMPITGQDLWWLKKAK
jgi:ubiquinone/menaquinone biosynthesis C-methylase UbiE